MFRLFRSRLVWLTIGLLTLAGTAFWIAVVIVAVVTSTAAGGADPDPDELAQVAVPLGMLAALAAAVSGIAVVVVIRRGRARQWVPLREQMVRDAALPGTHLAQVVSPANPAAGGQVLARDLISGYQGRLWLPGWNMPRGAVVCFTATPNGPQVRAWMAGQLWRATSREAARIERRTTTAYTAAEREQHDVVERQIRDAAAEAIAEAERILRQHERG